MPKFAKLMPIEVWLAGCFSGTTLAIALLFNLPIVLPNASSASFVGVHYLYPLFGIGIWAAFVMLSGKQQLGRTFLIAFPCYAVILLCHFNLKLWIVHINPSVWDEVYWQTDQFFAPLIAASMQARLAISPVISLNSNFYMVGFIALFYLSFCYHAFKDRGEFRELVLASMLFQIIGSFAYFVAPAIGPFLYEAGVEPPATHAQQHMLQLWEENRIGGRAWLEANASEQFTGGLAAMPSLHAGGSLLFLIFAWRFAKELLWPMIPLFVFISVTAIANRWHYLADLPVGWAIAALAAYLAFKITNATPEAQTEAGNPKALGHKTAGTRQ